MTSRNAVIELSMRVAVARLRLTAAKKAAAQPDATSADRAEVKAAEDELETATEDLRHSVYAQMRDS